MGRKKVTMFSMNNFVNYHILEKLDKSEYTYPDAEENINNVDDSESENSVESVWKHSRGTAKKISAFHMPFKFSFFWFI